MAINFDSALGIHESALKVRARRAEVLADNLANADTPNFKARDIDFKTLLEQQGEMQRRGLEMQTNKTGHIQGGATLFPANELLYRTPQAPSADGNTVEGHVEHAKYMENALAFQSSFTFLNSKFKGLMTAIRGE